ncbi:DUF2460 domain-containing protein [Meridianimarinicoccus sp. RP-17]|uniref:DUF2460 domain-containing protein n=1 Tax=Meridianimarinicoccus zhengii TaxID=2056810 RepID=UPI000DAD72C7|nr:DUF2460 domain-containing protein [Phycocomes zhengii]
MTGFHEVRFPDAIARGVTGGPAYDTSVITTAAGFERRNANWSQARGRWDAGSGLRRRADFSALIAFFRARQGRAYGFRFKDWTDFRVETGFLGVGDGTRTAFQLIRIYDSGGIEAVRDIRKPVDGSVQVFLDGVPMSAGVSIDHRTGLVTFAVAPAEGAIVTATCEFDVPVRFDTDAMGLSLDSFEQGSWPQIPLVEIRP